MVINAKAAASTRLLTQQMATKRLFSVSQAMSTKIEQTTENATIQTEDPAKVYPTDVNGQVKKDFSLVLADSALMRIQFLKKKDSSKYAVLKILVEASGCSGFSYHFDLISEEQLARDQAEMEDVLMFEKNGVRVLSDELTLEMINGSTIDYV